MSWLLFPHVSHVHVKTLQYQVRKWKTKDRLLLHLQLHLLSPANNRSRATDRLHLSWCLFNHKHWQHLHPQWYVIISWFVTVKTHSVLVLWKVPPSCPVQKQKHFHSSLAKSAADPQLSQDTVSLAHSCVSTYWISDMGHFQTMEAACMLLSSPTW